MKTLQKTFRTRTEDTSIIGRSQAWSYSNNKFRKSLTIEFHPSARCNFSCQHCQGGPYRRSWGSKPPSMKEDLVRRFFIAYDDRKDTSIGMWRIIISGMTGEPTLNSKVTRLIVREAKKRGIALGLSTSGILLKSDDLEILTSDNTCSDWLNLSVDSPIGTDPRIGRIYQRVHGYPRSDGLPRFMRKLEQAAEMKVKKNSTVQINVDWVISDLSFDTDNIEEDVVETIRYLNSIEGVSLLRLQLPFHLHDDIPELSDENSAALADTLERIRTGQIRFDELRDDFLVKLRNNWYKRLSLIEECSAARDYGVIFGPDGETYFCPYTASPAFKDSMPVKPKITVENIWEMLEKVLPLNVIDSVRCQTTCALKNCFVDLGIVR